MALARCVLVVYFLRTPSRAPYRTPPACANRAAYPDPPPVVPDPESIDARASYRGRHSTIARLSPARIVSRHWRRGVPAVGPRGAAGAARALPAGRQRARGRVGELFGAACVGVYTL